MTFSVVRRIDVLSGFFSLLLIAVVACWQPQPGYAGGQSVPAVGMAGAQIAYGAAHRVLLPGQEAETPDAASSEKSDSAWTWIFTFFLGVLLVGGGCAWWVRGQQEQAQRDRILFHANPEPIVLTDYRWRIVDANPAACALFGYDEDKIKLFTLNGLIESQTDLDPRVIRTTVDAGETLAFEAVLEQNDEYTIDLAVTTRKVQVGDQDFLLTALHEITQHKNEQRTFRAFHQRLVEDLPIEVVVVAPRGSYVYANPKAIPDRELREYMIGQTDIEYCQEMGYHPEVALRRRSHRRRVVSTRSTLSFEETLPNDEGSYRTFTRIMSPVLDDNGNVTAVVVYGVETTELKKYQDQMAAVRNESERLAELKESFLANISHEFRTPLTGILGFAQLLQEDVGPEQREFVDIILRNGRRLMATLNSMVDLSKLHSNYLEMNPTVFNLVEEVKEVAHSVAGMAKEKKLYLRLRATRPEILVNLDRAHLFRVLENLIGNAIKFTHTGGVVVEVHGDAEHVYVKVMDSGVGIRNEFLPFLFEEFNQESSGLSRNFEGTGIGLSVVKRLIDLMEGTISVDSEKGEGSMFTITFPAAFPPEESDGELVRSRLLVADASEETHTLIQYVLAPYFDIEYARDFPTAMQAAQATKYDVVLLDAEFGEANSAADALAPIRALRGYDRVPIVALDPHPEHGGEVHFLTAGYDMYLHKPLDKSMLLDSMGKLFVRHQKRRKHLQS